METEIRNLPKSKMEILFELSPRELEIYLQKAIEELGKDLNFKGFRPGRAPKGIIERIAGQNNVLMKAAEIAIEKECTELVLAKNLQVISQPQVEILKLAPGNPFCFRATVEVLQPFQLPDYKKIAQKVKKKEITEASIKEEELLDALEWLRQSRANFKDLQCPAREGDFLEIEYKSPQIAANKPFQDRFLLGEGHFVPGFEDNLREMVAGQEKEFELRFPEEHGNKQLAGTNVKFKVRVKRVQARELPELNDEFARALGSFEDFRDLRQKLLQGLVEEKRIAERHKRRAEILEELVKEVQVEVPQTLIELEKENIFQSGENKAGRQVLKKRLDREEDQTLEAKAEKQAKESLILGAIGREEGVMVKDSEVQQVAQAFLTRYKSIEQTEKALAPDRLIGYCRSMLFTEKVLEKLESF